jgi:hypothetical protein
MILVYSRALLRLQQSLQPRVKLSKRTKTGERLQQMGLRDNTGLRVLPICQLVRNIANLNMERDPNA